MLSVPDMALLGAAALLLFGPEQLPKVVRKVGQFTRDIQNTSQSFIREMERAADVHDTPAPPYAPPADPHAMETYEPFPFDDVTPHVDHIPAAGEKLAEPSPALGDAATAASPALETSATQSSADDASALADTTAMHEVGLPLTSGETAHPLATADDVPLPMTNGEAVPHVNGTLPADRAEP